MGFPYKLDEHGLQGIPSKLPDRDLQLLVDDTRALLRDFIDSRDIPEMTVAGDRLAASYSFKNLVTTPFVSSDGRIVRMVAGPLREVWIFSLLEHAAKFSLSKIKRCPLAKKEKDGKPVSDCDRYFVPTRHQIYCSRRCVNVANKRTWREKKEEKARKSEAANKNRRARYAKKKNAASE